MTRLSTHFSLKELTRSQTAERKGIKNTPNDAEINNLKLLCENILEPVREHYGTRSPQHGDRPMDQGAPGLRPIASGVLQGENTRLRMGAL